MVGILNKKAAGALPAANIGPAGEYRQNERRTMIYENSTLTVVEFVKILDALPGAWLAFHSERDEAKACQFLRGGDDRFASPIPDAQWEDFSEWLPSVMRVRSEGNLLCVCAADWTRHVKRSWSKWN